MSEHHVMTIKSDGEISMLQSDKFDIRFLGKMVMERASNIVFDYDDQMYRILIAEREDEPHPDELRRFPLYEDAKSFEVMYLQSARMCNYDPLSPVMAALAPDIRAAWQQGRRKPYDLLEIQV